MMHITITARIRWSDGSHFSSSAKLELNYKHNEGTSSEIWGLLDATLPQQIADVWHAFSTVAHRVHISGHTEAGEKEKERKRVREEEGEWTLQTQYKFHFCGGEPDLPLL